ncbi:MAG: sulfotransferase domain-containing protein [Caldilineaceae bacterium]
MQQIQAPLMAESTRRGLMYRPQPSDLFITPFAKCGTTWLQQVVHGLRTGAIWISTTSRVIPGSKWRIAKNWISMLTAAFRRSNATSVGARSPKGDAILSPSVTPKTPWSPCMPCSTVGIGNPAISIAEYARHFFLHAQGDGWNGSYWGHLVSWWDQRLNPNVLLLAYEGMKADLPATVQTIADFLAIDLDPALHELVVKQASFDFMMAHKSKFADPIARSTAAKEGLWLPVETFTKMRNGRVGDHRVELPTEIGWRWTPSGATVSPNGVVFVSSPAGSVGLGSVLPRNIGMQLHVAVDP